MRVLSVAYPFASVTPFTAGGAEQVLLTMDRALENSGNRSFVVAQEGSRVSGRLLSVRKVRGIIDGDVRRRTYEAYRAVIIRAIDESEADLVHMHGIDFHEYMPPEGMPVLVTLHLPLAWYSEPALRTKRLHTFFNCVSNSQSQSAPAGTGPFMCIENGVDIAGYPEKASKGYVLSMGRICPEKGFHIAMDAANDAGLPFIMAGAVFRYGAHEEYFRLMIAPRLGHGCRFIGTAGPWKRKRLLSGALCVVVPSLVPETSSLVAMEALASGTPVVAFPNGALPDIVEHGKTGFLVKDQREMAIAIRDCERISPEACRQAAVTRFSSEAMVSGYFAAYREISGKRNEGDVHPDTYR